MVCILLSNCWYWCYNFRIMIELTNKFDFPEGLVLPVDKPYGWSSADVVRKVKSALRKLGYKTIKVGHAGTLDPLATGILLVCIGKATKKAEEMQARPKEYLAEVELGATTPSYDLEYEVDERYPFEHITKEMVEIALQSFLGEQEQMPPIFSAKSIDGKRAYKYAREGIEVKMRPSMINIHEIELLSYDLPKVIFRVKCSKGTYIRSMAFDLGKKLESGGHLTGLRRTENGDFSMKDIMTLESVLESIAPDVAEQTQE